MRMRIGVLALLAIVLTACSQVPTAPTVPQVVNTITYTINVPTLADTNALRVAFPTGVLMSPIAAQVRFDYTAAYHGSPNVYAGESTAAIGTQQYQLTGIVLAPVSIANRDTFACADWSTTAPFGGTCSWLGQFAYTLPRER